MTPPHVSHPLLPMVRSLGGENDRRSRFSRSFSKVFSSAIFFFDLLSLYQSKKKKNNQKRNRRASTFPSLPSSPLLLAPSSFLHFLRHHLFSSFFLFFFFFFTYSFTASFFFFSFSFSFPFLFPTFFSDAWTSRVFSTEYCDSFLF